MGRTLVIIKSDGMKCRLVGNIIQRFEAKGLTITEMKLETMTPELTREHYQHLAEHGFFNELTDCMIFGPIVCLMLADEEVIGIIHKMVRATKAVDAIPGTIRGDYALPGTESITHVSDLRDAAVKKITRFFPSFDMNRPSEKAAK